MLGSRWYAGGFLHHGMLGGTTLYIKEGCKSYSKKDKVCSKRYEFPYFLRSAVVVAESTVVVLNHKI